MEKKKKTAKQQERRLSKKALGILLLAVLTLYLGLTAAWAQVSPKSSQNTGVTYTADYLSWGDAYSFGATEFDESNYSLTNSSSSVSLYTKKADGDKTAANFTVYKYYGTVKTGEHSGVSNGVIMATHDSSEFATTNMTQTTVDAPIGNGQTIPVMTTTGTARYSIVPNSTGTYRIYVNAASNPTGVKYALLDSYTAANAYGGTPSGSLSFTQISGTDWWYADVNISKLGWTAWQLSVAKSGSTAGSATNDTNGGQTFTGRQLTNSTLGSDYYYNIWTMTELFYDTVLVVQFPSTAKLGPITKTGDTFTYSQAEGGEISVKTVFNQNVVSGSSQAHMPLYITATPSEGGNYAFTGLDGISANAGIESVTDSLFRFNGFEQSENVTAKWEVKRDLPAVTVSGADSRSLDFYLNESTAVDMIAGTAQTYHFAFDFSGAESGSAVTYSVAYSDNSGGNTSGTLSADGGFDVSLAWGTATVTLTAKIGGETIKTITYTVTADESGYPYVASIGNTKYHFMEDAIAAAVNGNTIVSLADYEFQTMPKAAWGAVGTGAGYVIKSGVKWVLPYASGKTTIETSGNYPNANAAHTTAATSGASAINYKSSVYITVTVPEGINLVNNGTIAVGGTMCGNGAPIGAHANLQVDGTITMGNSSIMSAVGFVTGNGTVSATGSGAKMYQCFAVIDFGGGGYTVSAAGKGVSSSYGVNCPSGENGIVPFIRYVTENYMCNVVLKQGNYMYGYCDLYAGGGHNYTCACLVGDSTTTGLVTLGSGATLYTSYDETLFSSNNTGVGKKTLRVNGGGSLGKLVMDVGVDVDMSKYAFPIPYNYDIVMENGAFEFIYDMQILPGATFTVASDASLAITSNSRLSVYDGLHEFRNGGNSASSYTTAWSTTYGRYPAASTLGTVSHGTYTGNLIVDGTLTINSGSTLGGIVQTHGSGTVVMNGTAAAVSNQMGLVGNASTNNGTYIWAGATVYTRTPQIFDTLTGQRIAMQAGLTYHGSTGSSILDDFTYELYTDSASPSTHETHTEVINGNTEGSWWNYTGTVNMVDGSGNILSSTTTHAAAGADVSHYYTDAACTTHATTVSADNFVLYSNDVEARVEWADNSGTTYYDSLNGAVRAASHTGDTVVLMKDVTLTETVGISSTQNINLKLADGAQTYTVTALCEFLKNSGTLNLDVGGSTVATDAANAAAIVQTAFISNTGTMIIDLKGGTLSFASGASGDAVSTYNGKAAVVNDGTLTITDSSEDNDGKITTDLYEKDSGYAKYVAAVINKPSATLTVTGGNLETTQAVNSYCGGIISYTNATITEISNATITVTNGSGVVNFDSSEIGSISDTTITILGTGGYGLSNYTTSTIGTIENTTINTANATTVYNYDGSSIDSILNSTFRITTPATKNTYVIYNYGGDIDTIDSCTIEGNSGINNRNLRGNANTTAATGATIKHYGHIGTITDTTVTVGQYAIYNGATIDEISGHSVFTAAPESAQVKTMATTALNGNVQCYTVFNSNTWWYDTAIWKDTNSGLVKTQVYKTDEAYLPHIGRITDTVEIHAVNTSTSADHGYALYNAGLIDEISGNVTIETHAHPNNAKITTSNYALLNTGGGIIKSIEGSVSCSASNRALQNSGQSTEVKVTTSSGTAAKPTTYGGQTLSEEYTYGSPSRINAITGGTYSATTQYALLNTGTVGGITNAVFSANNNVVYNETSLNSYYYWYKVFADGADKYTANTDYQRVYTYTRDMEHSGVIGTISGGSITATGAGYQAITNIGYIEALKNMTISTPTGKATSSSTYYPLVFNSDSRIAGCDYTYTTTYNGTDAYVTLYEYDYDYSPATINLIENVTMTNPQDYTIRNLGYINTIKDSSISAGTLNTIVNEVGPYATRKSYRYYSGTTPFATTKNVAEVTYDYTRVQPYIGLIDNSTIEANGTTYAIRNAGHIGTLTNNTITSKTTNTVYNAGTVATEFHSNVNTLRGVVAVAGTSLTNAYDTTANAKTETTVYALALIDCIGEGNTITGTYNTITNAGIITSIDSDSGTPSQIIGTARAALYNYTGNITNRVRTATLKADNTNASSTDALEYTPAEIGTIKHTYFQGARNVLVNGSGDALYDPVKITEIGEGAEFYNGAAAYSVVTNNAAYAQIVEISGGIFRNNKSGTYYALYNASTTYPILLSGGDFRNYTTGSSTGRARAVYNFDDPTYITYAPGKYLSTAKDTRTPPNAVNANVNVSGYYYLVDVDPVAKIVWADTTKEDTNFWTVQAAVDAVEDPGDTIVLLKDISGKGKYTIPADKTVTLDLNGHTLAYTTGATAAAATYNGVAAITNNGTLTIQDTSASGTGKISTDACGTGDDADGRSSALRNNSGATLTITGGTIEMNPAAGSKCAAIINVSGGTITEISGGTINAVRGNAIYNVGTITEISGGTFDALYSTVYNLSAGTIGTISGGEYKSGITWETGYSAVFNCGTINEISGGVFTSKHSASTLEYEKYPTLANRPGGTIGTISGGVFTNQNATGYAVYNDTSNVISITGGHFKSGADTQTGAVLDWDNTAKYTYPTGKTLSSGTESATVNGSSVDGYYYIASVFTITFNANEGTGTMDPLTVESGQSVTLTANAFTRENYEFAGWNTVAAPTTETPGVAYIDEAEITVTDNMTLYAQWTSLATGYHVSVEDYVTDGDGGYDFETSLVEGDYTEVTFTVYCEKACIILWAPASDEEDLTRVIGEEVEDDTYAFTIEDLTEDITIYIILKGDGDLNGEVDLDDYDIIEQSQYSPRDPDHLDLTELQNLILDLDLSEEVDLDDYDLLEQSLYSPRDPDYAPLVWDN